MFKKIAFNEKKNDNILIKIDDEKNKKVDSDIKKTLDHARMKTHTLSQATIYLDIDKIIQLLGITL